MSCKVEVVCFFLLSKGSRRWVDRVGSSQFRQGERYSNGKDKSKRSKKNIKK